MARLVDSADESLLVVSPYIKHAAAKWLVDRVGGRRPRHSIHATILTDISPASALDSSLDISALLLLSEHFQRASIFDVHRLHAKVYVADRKQAIITSGNLTSSAFATNYEYGVVVTEPRLVSMVADDLHKYAKAGRQVTRDELARLEEASRDLAGRYRQTTERAGSEVRRELANEWDRIAAAFGAPPGLYEAGSARFKGLIIEVLTSRGPLTTNDLCRMIEASWPELCDNTVMRIAKDGTRKRQWRHDIHTAQETLQRQGVLRRDTKGLWHLEEGGR